MTHNGGESVFQFINESDGRGPRDPATRKTIRRQAMSKTAAARRQQGKHGKTNLRQYPIFLGQSRSNPTLPVSDPKAPEGPHGKSDTATAKGGASSRPPEADFRGNHFSSSLLLSRTIPASLPSVGYESMRIQYDFDVLDLSALTSFHAGRATAQALMHDPSRLIDVLRCKQWSYLSFLPSRFGHVDCLDDAARCLAAKARHQLLSPTNPPNVIVVSLYSRALASLQSALSDPDRFLQPDVLCATEILAIYEVGGTSLLSMPGTPARISNKAAR